MLRLIKCVQIVFAALLLGDSLILAVRLLFGGGGRIGGDAIYELYVLSGLSLVTTIWVFFLERGKRSMIDVLTHCASVLGVILWLSLHPTGLIYSHESLFLSKEEDMKEMLRLLRESERADQQEQNPKQN